MTLRPDSDLAARMAADGRSLETLKHAARDNSPEAVKAVAAQFEALFVNMMLKSMREAGSQDGLFDNEHSRTFTAMLDQQWSQHIAQRGLGLADMLTRQLLQQSPALPPADAAPAARSAVPASAAAPAPRPALPNPAAAATLPPHAAAFVREMQAPAAAASRASGIPAHYLIAQAALESGWGRRQITAADGSPSHNLFGIKAGAGWRGQVAESVTTEYLNGVPQKRIEAFRAYGSYAEAFRDFAALMQTPRYRAVLASRDDADGYARALQQAGYATDPRYADKLAGMIARVAAA